MSQCDRIKANISFYLDGELSGDERREFRAHLRRCSDCSRAVEVERGFLDSLRDAAPLYNAPADLRERVTRLVHNLPTPYTAPPELYDRVRRLIWRNASLAEGRRLRFGVMVSAALALAALSLGAWYGISRAIRPRGVRPPDFELLAVDTHLRHLRGQLPLEIDSFSPEEVSKWFVNKIAFTLKLPNYQESSGQEQLYQLLGARLISFQNKYAAFISYRSYDKPPRPITLLITSDSVAPSSRGQEIVSKGITFHYDCVDNLKVITWSHEGLTYALVSDLEERGQQSCMVCHQGTRDKDFLEGLNLDAKPRSGPAQTNRR